MNFNQPNDSNEEAKAQAAIDNILGVSSNVAPIEPAPIDTNKLFDFAGLDTNRNDSAPDQFIFDAQPAAAQAQPAAQPNEAANAGAVNDANNALGDFM